MAKRASLIYLSILALFLFTTIVSAADVAYIYRHSSNIDDNILNVFQEMNLSVDLIKETALPASFSQYRMLFLGDENFRNRDRIPVNDKPSVVANYYNGEAWGLTDKDGASQYGATHPLSVLINAHMIQVYTQTFKQQTVALTYYYLDKDNKSPAFTQVAGTETASSGFKIGDVISQAPAGSTLINSKLAKGNICFFGIIESDFWTPAARNLFKDCVGYVISACNSDSQCPSSSISQPFCKEGDVYQTTTSHSCQNPGSVTAQCVPSDSDNLIENCQFGCQDGSCLPGSHDVALIDFPGSTNKIRIEDSNSTLISTNELLCNSSYKIIINVENTGDLIENVTFQGSAGSLSFSHVKIDNLLPDEIKEKTRTLNFNLNEGFYNISVEAIIANDSNPSDNLAEREVFVSCPVIICSTNADCNDNNSTTQDVCHNPGTPSSFCTNEPITCSSNTDCGIDGPIGSPFCSANNVTQQFRSFTCNSPGTPQSFCSSQNSTQTQETCSDICISGQCHRIECFTNTECNDSNPRTIDECLNPGTIISECRNTPLNCLSNSDCGFTGFIGQEFCSSNNINKNFQNATCQNQGTLQSFCTLSVEQLELAQCQFACFEGACIRCDTNADCNDSNPNTQDICNLPGTLQSSCSNNPITITCSQNSDCGIDGPIGSPFCSANNVTQQFRSFTCNAPNTPQSFCSSQTTQQTIEICSSSCSNGQCTTPNIECFTDAECGTNGFISSPFCSANNVTRNFRSFTCNNPATPSSFCSTSTSPITIEQCSDACSAGQCVEIICSTNADCNDSNPNTQDICHNPGTPLSFCTNEPITCFTNSDCGTNGFIGSEFCSSNNVVKNFKTFTCNSPGTPSSFCSSLISPQTLEVCTNTCSNGQCTTPTITCSTNSDCGSDGPIGSPFCSANNVTQQFRSFTCNAPNTPSSFCSSQTTQQTIEQCTEDSETCISGVCQDIDLDTIECFSSSDCGFTGFLTNNFCSENNVIRLFQSAICHSPGTPQSFCTIDTSLITTEQCQFVCSSGECVRCSSNADCSTGSTCVHPGTPSSYCNSNSLYILPRNWQNRPSSPSD